MIRSAVACSFGVVFLILALDSSREIGSVALWLDSSCVCWGCFIFPRRPPQSFDWRGRVCSELFLRLAPDPNDESARSGSDRTWRCQSFSQKRLRWVPGELLNSPNRSSLTRVLALRQEVKVLCELALRPNLFVCLESNCFSIVFRYF